MSLRTILLTILSGVVLLFLVCVWTIQRRLIFPTFLSLEDDRAVRNLDRVVAAIRNEVPHLDAFTEDWASWDDTYAFIAAPDEKYAENNLSKTYYKGGNFSAAYYVDLEGHVIFGQARDPLNDYEDTTIQALSGSTWPLDHPLLANHDITQGTSGWIATEHGPMMVSSRPIIHSSTEGPMRGWLVLLKQLTPDILQGLRKQTELDFELLTYAPSGLATRDQAALLALEDGAKNVIDRLDDERMCVYGSLRDFLAKPIYLVRLPLDRDISARGKVAMDFSLVSTMVASLLLLGALVGLLQRFVVSPVTRLTAHAVAIGASDDLLTRLHSDRKDEIGVLTREFDSMVGRVAESRAKLMEVARLGGRSEVATSVLHNVGNVLNSVNVSKDVLQSKLAGVDEKTLEQLLGLLIAHPSDLGEFISNDPTGRHLPHFLKVMVENLADNQRSVRTEMVELGQGIEHLRTLVAAQQEFAGAGGVAEFTSMAELVESAIRIASSKLHSPAIAFERDVEAGLPLFKLQKHKALEVLVNLVGNACDAVAASGRGDKRILVRVRRLESQRVRFQVEDNGLGICPENLPKLFSFGFTTKPGGHGFGLHASANVIREMGGEVSATSEGADLGARFTIEVPFEREAAAPFAAPAPS